MCVWLWDFFDSDEWGEYEMSKKITSDTMIVTKLLDRAVFWVPFFLEIWRPFWVCFCTVQSFFMQFCTYILAIISCHKTEKRLWHIASLGPFWFIMGSILVFLHVFRNSKFPYDKCTGLLGITLVVTQQKPSWIFFCLGLFGNILHFGICSLNSIEPSITFIWIFVFHVYVNIFICMQIDFYLSIYL